MFNALLFSICFIKVFGYTELQLDDSPNERILSLTTSPYLENIFLAIIEDTEQTGNTSILMIEIDEN